MSEGRALLEKHDISRLRPILVSLLRTRDTPDFVKTDTTALKEQLMAQRLLTPQLLTEIEKIGQIDDSAPSGLYD